MKPKPFINRETKWTADEIVKNFDIPPNVTSTIDSSGNDSECEKSFDKIQEHERDGEGSEKAIMLEDLDSKQCKLLSALFPKTNCDKASNNGGGSKSNRDKETVLTKCEEKQKRGPKKNKNATDTESLKTMKKNLKNSAKEESTSTLGPMADVWIQRVGSWYDSLAHYSAPYAQKEYTEDDNRLTHYQALFEYDEAKYRARRGTTNTTRQQDLKKSQNNNANSKPNLHSSKNFNANFQNITSGAANWLYFETNSQQNFPVTSSNHVTRRSINKNQNKKEVYRYDCKNHNYQSDHWTNGTDNKYGGSCDYLHDDDFTQLRKQYRASVGNNLIVPRLSINPKNVRSMTIGKQVSFESDNERINLGDRKDDIDTSITKTIYNLNDGDVFTNTIGAMEILSCSIRTSTPEPFQDNTIIEEADNKTKADNDVGREISDGSKLKHLDNLTEETNNNEQEAITPQEEKPTCRYKESCKEIELKDFQVTHTNQEDSPNEVEMVDFTSRYRDKNPSFENKNEYELDDIPSKQMKTNSNQVELKEISSQRRQQNNKRYFADQQKLFHVLDISNLDNSDKEHSFTFIDDNNETVQTNLRTNQTVAEPVHVKEVNLDISEVIFIETNQIQPPNVEELKIEELSNAQVESPKDVVQISTSAKVSDEQYVIAELRNSAYVFLTLPDQVLSTASAPVHLQIENNDNLPEEKSKMKKDKLVNRKMKTENNTALRALLLEHLCKVVDKGVVANNEVGLPNN